MVESKDILIYLSVTYKGDWDKIFEAIREHNDYDEEEVIRIAHSLKSKAVTIMDDDYPKYLKEIYHPPFVLFYYGDLSILNDINKNISVIGARECSNYGELMTTNLVKHCAKYLNIISGLAIGIDSIASRVALQNNGKTCAVLGCGIDYCYPPLNKSLYKDIKEKGLLISEYPNSVEPIPNFFAFRNRIIAALSKATLIVEAKCRSGTSITSRYALEFGRDVYCVPERATEDSLCNELIQAGAKLVKKSIDILEEYHIEIEPEIFSL